MQLFLGSLTDWITHISANSIIMMIMMIFMVIGGVDYIRGNKLGYGKEFEEGFKTMGTLAMAVAAIIAIAPCLSQWIRPLVTPIAHAIGADPSVVAGIFYLVLIWEDILWRLRLQKMKRWENSMDLS